MSNQISQNSKAILLLTAPLIAGRNTPSAKVLTLAEYNKLARFLVKCNLQPSDLIATSSSVHIEACATLFDKQRLEALLSRGFLLSQALERWNSRSIWVLSRADAKYPARLKSKLKESAPVIIYGCGSLSNLEAGGLAVVGSRNTSEELLTYSRTIGELAAKAKIVVVSGNARGVDQAAMKGGLDSQGKVVGVVSDSLEKAALSRDHRTAILEKRFTVISPFDPLAGFSVGNAMQRNKLIYALADAALVISSDYGKGGTWSGASEWLKRFSGTSLYVRAGGDVERGLQELKKLGAKLWPNVSASAQLYMLIAEQKGASSGMAPNQGDVVVQTRPTDESGVLSGTVVANQKKSIELDSQLLSLLRHEGRSMTAKELSESLGTKLSAVKRVLGNLTSLKLIEKSGRPSRYGITTAVQASLFGGVDQSRPKSRKVRRIEKDSKR